VRAIVQEVVSRHTPESLTALLAGESGLVLLRSSLTGGAQGRYSFVAARPFVSFRSYGARCEVMAGKARHVEYGNPWRVLDRLLARYELLDEVDLPFPLGGCFGYWGYELNHFVEPRLRRQAVNDLELPDCQVGCYDSLVVFDHALAKTWVVSSGLELDGSRTVTRALAGVDFWRRLLETGLLAKADGELAAPGRHCGDSSRPVWSNLNREQFLAAVAQAQRYIRAGDIYQVNLAQRLATSHVDSPWGLYRRLAASSPAPFAAFLECGDFQVVSSSPELFLRLSGSGIHTRPIKGTRPRSADPARDARLSVELQSSPKEMAELVMITDLLRNDLGRVCEYGSVQVPELARLERYAQVQHLVSTVQGQLRPEVTHLTALAACFPGGSVTGAPKVRAMEIIDELEPETRGPYTGALGYLGFNRESQLSIVIRTAIRAGRQTYFHVGAGIVADSDPAAEYEETLAKARGFFAALAAAEVSSPQTVFSPSPAGGKA
jgi:para-aminobenzoate synthetase component 1